MHRRTFLNGLLGIAGAAVGATIATRAEALTPTRSPEPARTPDAPQNVSDPKPDEKLSRKLPQNSEIEEVAWRRRRVYRRRVYRRRVYRRPVRRRVCRVRRNRWGRVTRVCTWR